MSLDGSTSDDTLKTMQSRLVPSQCGDGCANPLDGFSDGLDAAFEDLSNSIRRERAMKNRSLVGIAIAAVLAAVLCVARTNAQVGGEEIQGASSKEISNPMIQLVQSRQSTTGTAKLIQTGLHPIEGARKLR